jgi:hypothetical protein
MNSGAGSLKHVKDMEKLLENENIWKAIFIQMALQVRI